MKLIYNLQDINGLKILIAVRVSGKLLSEYCKAKDDFIGVQLQVIKDGLSCNLQPNSAVLYIMDSKLLSDEAKSILFKWLDWESAFQKKILVSQEKDEKINFETLQNSLTYLNANIFCPEGYFLKNISAVDIVIYSTLSYFFKKPKYSKLLSKYEQLEKYLNFLAKDLSFKEAEDFFNGGDKLRSNFISTGGSLKEEESNSVPAVNMEEISKAESAWKTTVQDTFRKAANPVLPVNGEKNIFITSALPYVNNVPHLGNIIGCVLSADCFARFCRLTDANVLYICGTDEYGTATETKALAENLSPKEICAKYHYIHSEVYKWFNIKFDYFGRTTTESQTNIAQSMFWDLEKNGFINRNLVEQLYCQKCENFLADRFVWGSCPHPGCGYDDARGDQCDGCSKLVNATDLINPKCKICSSTPEVRSSKHLFLDLPGIEPSLKDWIKKSSSQWSANARNICESWVRDGLKERCITRDLKWGTPVPLEGYQDKVFYVWYDAPIGYISITMEYTNQWEQWWLNPSNVQYYEFMAKDNVPFHSVIFPSCQLGTGKQWTMVSNLEATEYLNYEDGKFSKSRGVGVFGDEAAKTGIASDVWRFYLLYIRPETHDSSFSWIDLQTKNNSELLNNIGNFINRSLKFVYQFYSGVIPEANPEQADYLVMASINKELRLYIDALSNCRLRDGIRHLLSISRIGNLYIQNNEPFKLIKPDRSDKEKLRGATVIHISANIAALIAILLEPYMPDTSKTILGFLNQPKNLQSLPDSLHQFLPSGHRINEPYPLIKKITDDEINSFKGKFGGGSSSDSSTVPQNASAKSVQSKSQNKKKGNKEKKK